MRHVFADTSYYQALLNPNDSWHTAARHVSDAYRGRVTTSEFILCELGALMSRGASRQLFVEFVQILRTSPGVDVVPSSNSLFESGLRLYSERRDKDWSLIDRISFVLMRELGLRDALASDHHFEQAGFRRLLDRS